MDVYGSEPGLIFQAFLYARILRGATERERRIGDAITMLGVARVMHSISPPQPLNEDEMTADLE